MRLLGVKVAVILDFVLVSCGPMLSVSRPLPLGDAPRIMAAITGASRPLLVSIANSPALPSPGPTLRPLVDAALQSHVEGIGTAFVDTGMNPGLSVALVQRNPRTRQLEAMLLNFGTAEKDGGNPVDSNTVYEIGSITKIFTGVLLAEAVDAGRMKLSDPIQNYLPEGVTAPTYEGAPITLAQLATHRSGLPRDLGSDSLSDLYSWLNGFDLERPPGAGYAYSNLGFALLGDILARNANTDYGTLAFQSVSQPLGLWNTSEALSEDQASRLAQGYSGDGSPAAYFPESGAMSGAGYLHSSLNDMARFVAENMDPDSTPLPRDLLLAQQVESEGPNPGTGTGLGWEIEALGAPQQRLFKGGVTLGFSSYISISNDRTWGLALLSNGMHVDSLASSLIRLLDKRNKWLQFLPAYPGGRR
jgi:CubicO group peptidase (beta-lactamase class C family)